MVGPAYPNDHVLRRLAVLREIVYDSSDWVNEIRCLRNTIEFEVELLFLLVNERMVLTKFLVVTLSRASGNLPMNLDNSCWSSLSHTLAVK
jgi:hypothetical protein